VATANRVQQKSFEALAASLITLQAEYEAAPDKSSKMSIRREVIAAKTKARWASLRAKSEAKRAEKTEMAEWMLTWLENPPVFESWVRIRLLLRRDRDLDSRSPD
jgi:hypothetical protein